MNVVQASAGREAAMASPAIDAASAICLSMSVIAWGRDGFAGPSPSWEVRNPLRVPNDRRIRGSRAYRLAPRAAGGAARVRRGAVAPADGGVGPVLSHQGG